MLAPSKNELGNFPIAWNQSHLILIWTFVDKVMPLLFNTLSRLVITFLPRSRSLLISWLQSPSAVILEHKKIKSATISTVSPSICHEVMGPDAINKGLSSQGYGFSSSHVWM